MSNKSFVKLLYNLTLLTVASIPFDGLNIELGATLKLSRVFGMLAIFTLILFLSSTSSKKFKNLPNSFYLVFKVLSVFFLVTLLSNLIFLTEIIKPEAQNYFLQQFGNDGLSIFRTALKPIQAAIATAINFSWLLIPILVIRSNLQIMQIAWTYVISSSIQGLLGIVQYMYFLASGINLFPIYRGGLVGGYTQDAYVDLQGIRFLRVNALAGEPTGLALVLGFGIAITVFFLIEQSSDKKKLLATFCFIIQIISLFLTFSTIGYVCISSIVLLYVYFIKEKLLFIPVLTVTLALYVFLFDIPSFLLNLFEERILERIGFEDFDLVYVSFIQKSPSYLLLGTGFGTFHLATFEEASQILSWQFGIILPKLGIFSILATSGLVGAFVLSIIPVVVFSRLNNINKTKYVSNKKFYFCIKKLLAFMFIIGINIRFTIFGVLWLGIGFAVIENYRRFQKVSQSQNLQINYQVNYDA